jgi:hypothetical protein
MDIIMTVSSTVCEQGRSDRIWLSSVNACSAGGAHRLVALTNGREAAAR